MPVIPIKSNDWSELAFAVSRLCIDPKSFERSASLHDELEGNVVAGIVKHFGLDNVQPRRREFDLVHRAVPNQLPTVEANRTEIRDAYIAGQILKTALRLAHYEPKVGSIGKAQLIVMRGLKPGPHPLKISAIKTLWRRYRSVSHFPAAQFLAPKTFACRQNR